MQKRSFGLSTRVERVFRLIDRFDDTERRRLRAHAVALLLVAVVVALRLMVGGSGQATAFALLTLAVAGAALAGGLRSAFLAAMAAVLSARLVSDAGWVASLGFFAEAMLVAGLVVYVRSREEQATGWLAEADAEVQDLRTALRHHRIVSEAFDDLERASQRHVAIVLSSEGAITDWRPGAARLYLGDAPQAIGTSASQVFYPRLDSDELKTLLDRAKAEGTVLWRGVHQRFD